jgi:hypothetical protein
VGITRGIRGFTTAPYVFTTYRTAQALDSWLADHTVFVFARVSSGV